MLDVLHKNYLSLCHVMKSKISKQVEKRSVKGSMVVYMLKLWDSWMPMAKIFEELLFAFALTPLLLQKERQLHVMHNTEKLSLDICQGEVNSIVSLLKIPAKVVKFYNVFNGTMVEIQQSWKGEDSMATREQIIETVHKLVNKLVKCHKPISKVTTPTEYMKEYNVEQISSKLRSSTYACLAYLSSSEQASTTTPSDDRSMVMKIPNMWQSLSKVALNELRDNISDGMIHHCATACKTMAFIKRLHGNSLLPIELQPMKCNSGGMKCQADCPSTNKQTSHIGDVIGTLSSADKDTLMRMQFEYYEIMEHSISIANKYYSMLHAFKSSSKSFAKEYIALGKSCNQLAQRVIVSQDKRMALLTHQHDPVSSVSQSYIGAMLGHIMDFDRHSLYLYEGLTMMQRKYLKMIETYMEEESWTPLEGCHLIASIGLDAMQSAISFVACKSSTNNTVNNVELVVHQLLSMGCYMMIEGCEHMPSRMEHFLSVAEDADNVYKKWLTLQHDIRLTRNSNHGDSSSSIQSMLKARIVKVQLLYGCYKIYLRYLLDICNQSSFEDELQELSNIKEYWKPWRQVIIKLSTVIDLLPQVHSESPSALMDKGWNFEWDRNALELFVFWIEKYLEIILIRFDVMCKRIHSASTESIHNVSVSNLFSTCDEVFLNQASVFDYVSPSSSLSPALSCLDRLLVIGRSCSRIREWLDSLVVMLGGTNVENCVNEFETTVDHSLVNLVTSISSLL